MDKENASAPENCNFSVTAQKEENVHLIWTDVLRIIAIFGIIITHIASLEFMGDPKTMEWQACNIFNSLTRPCVAIFVMVSGVFLLNPDKEYSLKKLYFSKILKFIAIYLVCTVFFACYHQLYHGFSFDFSRIKRELSDGPGHLWFLFMICGLYIVSPFLRLITKDKRYIIYYLVLSLIFVSFAHLMITVPCLEKFYKQTLLRFELPFIFGYSGYFMLGYWLSTQQLSKKTRILIYISGIIAAIASVAINGYAGYHFNIRGTGFYNNISLPNVICATAVFVFCQYHFNTKTPFHLPAGIIAKVAKRCFGIYLIHPVFLTVTSSARLREIFLSPSPFIYIPLLAIGYFAGSLLIVMLLEKIPFVKKCII